MRRFLLPTPAAALFAAVLLLATGCSSAPTPSHPLRVACLGDSITYGAGIDGREKNSYPAQLAALLGASHEVRNFGVSGSTLLTAGDKPYRQQPEFAAALAFQPDLVVIALGTNDSKPQNWQHRAQFAADYAALIRQFRELPSHPRILICQPMPAYPPSAWGISPEIIERELQPLIADIARTEQTGLIDFFTPMRDHHDFTPDHVHPDARGAALLARAVAAALTAAR